MSKPQIRFATPRDEAGLLRFIDEHWKKGHILAAYPELFRWQHVPRHDPAQINFVLAVDEPQGEIQAILGYIPMAQFDPSLGSVDILLAMWKVRQDVKSPGLGILLLNWLQKNTSADFIAVIGLSKMVVPIYQAIRWEVGQLRQHVLLNLATEHFRIAGGVTPAMLPPKAAPSGQLVTLTAGMLPNGILPAHIDQLCARHLPRKSWKYLRGRYTRHPAYQYQFSFVVAEPGPKCLLVWRKIAAQDSAALRIVDLVGDEAALAGAAGDLQNLLAAHQAEYLDIDHWGVASEALTQAGFIDRRAQPLLVIPGHFEPFELRNIDVGFSYKIFNDANRLDVRLLRGDSDQDRPNRRPSG